MRRARFAIFVVLAAVPAATFAETVIVTPIFRGTATASGQPITLPSGPVQVTVSRFVIPPGATLPVHRHKYPRYAYVVSGTLRVTNTETGASNLYHAGEFVVEMIGAWHQGSNAGGDPVVLIVTDQTPPGESNTEMRDH
jgi:quercetin dioxygenase-like cupin family protein